jgi:hypothetical protein
MSPIVAFINTRALPNMSAPQDFESPISILLTAYLPLWDTIIFPLNTAPLTMHHLSSTHAYHLHSPPLHLHTCRPPSCIMSSYWMPTPTSSCSQPGHHSESEEKGQLQSRWSALSFLNLRHRQRVKSQSQVDADWFQNISTDSLFLK